MQPSNLHLHCCFYWHHHPRRDHRRSVLERIPALPPQPDPFVVALSPLGTTQRDRQQTRLSTCERDVSNCRNRFASQINSAIRISHVFRSLAKHAQPTILVTAINQSPIKRACTSTREHCRKLHDLNKSLTIRHFVRALS
jgi:hypothetical protein